MTVDGSEALVTEATAVGRGGGSKGRRRVGDEYRKERDN